ncbi:MAG: hypothetical protein IJT66_06565, partial [Clostridia bacterium]|nr:hypothetical protein [Clostridia bacterium]
MQTEKRLADIEKGIVGNDILPFFWMQGESEEDLLEELEAVYHSGIRSICLESRTHDEFASEGWWHDCDFLLREAKKRGMTVWVLDDKHFPTGYANGLVTSKYPERRKWHLMESHVDVTGPSKGTLILEAAGANFKKKERQLFAVIACKREGYQEVMTGQTLDLTEYVKDGMLYWQVPDGCWRIFMLYQTREGCMTPGYIHMIDEKSVDVLIEAVYEPHYRRYHEEFGKTFAGFFSDEPCFGNGAVDAFNNPLPRERWLGVPYQALPWRKDLLERLTEQLGEDAKPLLPALWYDCGEKTARMRYAYMDIVTALYRDCFNRRLGEWCWEHGVRYIGHVIEEQGFGMGAGHYFRSLDGQDMSGIDLIFQQVVPGLTEYRHTSWGSGHLADPEFNEYVLGKLGSSKAHIAKQANGKAMCEIFGATGWAEGTPLMKHLIDHMLVRGINCFVPHAFTTRFPNPDCPPHFYAKGNNAQFRDFKTLMDYTAKMCHLFSDGVHRCTAALLYHVDARW